MNSQVFVGIDVGSASVRAGIFDAAGNRLAFAARPIQQFHPLGAALLGAVACGAFASLPAAASDMVRPSGSVAARAETKAFHEAKYAVYLQLYQDMERCRSAMSAWP